MNDKHHAFLSDNIYATALRKIDQFSFSQQVVNVFPDMINRSVPGYQIIIDGIGKIAEQHCKQHNIKEPVVYDLGCSLGSVSLSIAKSLHDKNPIIHGLDNSEAMIAQCKNHIAAFNFSQSIQLHFADLIDFELLPCNIVVLNFTLQFISPEQRATIINKIFKALKPGGLLILSEKIKHDESYIENLLVDLHHDFKRENGYSDLEISQKRSALEDVMILDTVETHQQRIAKAGFSCSSLWFKQYNFMSLLAVKS